VYNFKSYSEERTVLALLNQGESEKFFDRRGLTNTVSIVNALVKV
jgi:hypothetical protein